MNQWNHSIRNEERKEDVPPYSRVFVVCSKDLHENDLREPFERYGEIQDIYMVKSRRTGEARGIAYIKYSKTTAAANAIQELHLKTIGNASKPIKVMVASSKNDKNDGKDEKCNRLFIKISKEATESDIRQHFSGIAHVESIHIQKDKTTNESKGLAYVQFKTFLDAAKAFEECDRKYKPMFATPPTPKHELKRGRDSLDNSFYSNNSNRSDSFVESFNPREDTMSRESITSLLRVKPQNYTTVCATCSPVVSQKHLEKLFFIVPGMLHFEYSVDTYNGFCKALVSYEDEREAAYAVERLNNFEFPSGEIVCVKPDNPLSKAADELTSIANSFKNAVGAGSPDLVQLANAIAQASNIIKSATSGKIDRPEELNQDRNYCNVSLPPPQPMASTARVAERCFIVCKPFPPPNNVLRDVFCRFGDLIDVSTIPNKTFGFAKYASARAAQEAIHTLHMATVCGAKIKVLKADEKPSKDDDQKMVIEDPFEFIDRDADRKRIKLQDQD